MKINFSAGPTALPRVAVERLRADLVDFEGTQLSVIEQSHRGAKYEHVQATAMGLLRSLLAIPDTHEILFLQGGARTQFAMLPLNLLRAGTSASYVITGYWPRCAYEEAAQLGAARVAADTSENDGSYHRVPSRDELRIEPDDAYVHICSNNTIEGTQWARYPETGSVPLIADMSSDLLSRKIDVARFGMIYAAAQKNLGPAGATVVIIRKDLIEGARRDIPKVWSYATHARQASMYYTPAMFAIATMRHVLEHATEIGGLDKIEATNDEKARRLYAALDARPEIYRVPAERDSRSRMTVSFFLRDADANARFLAEASRRGFVGLAGHRTVGGIRASIYNWVSLDDVDQLVALVEQFKG